MRMPLSLGDRMMKKWRSLARAYSFQWVLGGSLCAYFISGGLYFLFSRMWELYALEYGVFHLILAAFVVPVFLVVDRFRFFLLMAIQGIVMFILLRITPREQWFVLFYPVFALTTELGLFLSPLEAGLSSIALSTMVFAYVLLFLGGSPFWSAVLFGAMCAYALSLIRMIRYRDKFVESSNSSLSLREVVANLMRTNMDLQYFAAREGVQAAKRERLFLTREIHDIVGYSLSNITMLLNAARVADTQERIQSLIESAVAMSEGCLQDTRTILRQLRIPEQEIAKNTNRIKKLVTTFESATGVAVELHFAGFPDSAGDEVDSTMYRFVQIGLVNSFTHGKAQKVRILFQGDADCLSVRIWDNGKGIDQNFKMGIGLQGMHERLDALGGALTFANCVDGFEIVARIPRPKEQQ